MNSWTKGVLADALDFFRVRRKARHILANGARARQIDSTTGLLKGQRTDDKFYCEDGDFLQTDHSAPLNMLVRLNDRSNSRIALYRQVGRIPLSRSPAQLGVEGFELAKQFVQSSAGKSSA